MIILPDQDAVYVAIPKTGGMAMSHWLEKAFRQDGERFEVESLHDWHANLSEALDVSGFPLFRMQSFCVVRNPYDRLVSYCAMAYPNFQNDPQGVLYEDLTSPEMNRWQLPQVYFTEGIKTIYFFEYLDDVIRSVRHRLGIPDEIVFEKENESQRGHYREYFDSSLRELVMARYGQDLNAFDYRY